MADRKLTPKQARFVQEYVIDLNATQAAIRAGYSQKTADPQGPRLLGNVRVADAIAKAQAKMAKRTEITQDWVLNNIKTVVETCRQPGDGFDPAAVLRGAELAGRYLSMWNDKLKIQGDLGLSEVMGLLAGTRGAPQHDDHGSPSSSTH